MAHLEGVNLKLHDLVKDLLEPDEVVDLVVSENPVGSEEPFSPAIAFGTNKRVIIMRRGPITHRKRYAIIDYAAITEIKVKYGLRFTKIHFSLKGEQMDSANTASDWLCGLSKQDSMELLHFVEKMRAGIKKSESSD